jgi:hypothetical protein
VRRQKPESSAFSLLSLVMIFGRVSSASAAAELLLFEWPKRR